MVRGTGIEAGWQDGIGGKIELDLKGSCCSMNERSDCPEAIESMARQDRGYLNVMMIHELLHTLGLGENPPTSQDITVRVTNRCR